MKLGQQVRAITTENYLLKTRLVTLYQKGDEGYVAAIDGKAIYVKFRGSGHTIICPQDNLEEIR